MPFPYHPGLKAILDQRVEEKLLEGYYGGVFNTLEDKFYAVTLVGTSGIEYANFEYVHNNEMNGYSVSFFDGEKAKKHLSHDSWQGKSVTECIDEGIYQYFSVCFIGVLFKKEWFILKTLRFYGDEISETELKKHIEQEPLRDSFWNDDIFVPKKPIEIDCLGTKRTVRDVIFEEFKDEPYLMALLKQEKKDKVNRAFTDYINEAYLIPFFQKLRTHFPEQFVQAQVLRKGYPMIFPQHQKHTLFCAFVKNKEAKWQLLYFLLCNQSDRFYRWSYFTGNKYSSSFSYSELIINDLKQISHWDDDGFLDSSCTMDDRNFWDEYVFKKDERGNYLYLEEIHFSNL